MRSTVAYPSMSLRRTSANQVPSWILQYSDDSELGALEYHFPTCGRRLSKGPGHSVPLARNTHAVAIRTDRPSTIGCDSTSSPGQSPADPDTFLGSGIPTCFASFRTARRSEEPRDPPPTVHSTALCRPAG